MTPTDYVDARLRILRAIDRADVGMVTDAMKERRAVIAELAQVRVALDVLDSAKDR